MKLWAHASAPEPAAPREAIAGGAFGSLIFDLDGTLVESMPGIRRALKMACAGVIAQPPEDAFLRAMSLPLPAAVRILAPHAQPVTLELIEARFRAAYDAVCCTNTELFPGVLDAILRLTEAGVPCYIATNKRSVPTEKILAQLEIRSFFKDVLSCDSCEPLFASKAEAVRKLLVDHELDTNETILIGDSVEDYEAALANGIEFRGVAYGYGTGRLRERLDETAFIDSLQELVVIGSGHRTRVGQSSAR
jgi:phosphoglycolate phosphatase